MVLALHIQKKNEPKKIRSRRCLIKAFDGCSGPKNPSSTKVKLMKNNEEIDGKLDIGENIVEREYKKLKTNNLGVVERYTFSVYGKKHPLSKLRIQLFNKHQKYMRLNNDSYFESLTNEEVTERLISLNEYESGESIDIMKSKLKSFERTRNLVIWHDASSIANHGHILINIHVLYDPAVFYTSDEYENNQREIEEPVLHIIGRCRFNDEQLGYIETRLECLKSLQQI